MKGFGQLMAWGDVVERHDGIVGSCRGDVGEKPLKFTGKAVCENARMASRVIPLLDERHAWQPRLEVGEALPTDMGEAGTWASGQALSDLLGRPLHDLRISVTDRCNFRCSYCMPKEVFDQNHRYLPQSDLLSFEEITRLAARFVELGVRKIRLTGGEPLLRRGLETLIEQLARLRTPQGKALDLTLTTNGALLATPGCSASRSASMVWTTPCFAP
jgi:sulfatase maturation enzyme AslB (radical SAM superfamily)